VNGNLRGMARVQLDSGAAVTGLRVENGALLQIPKLSLSVTFTGTSQGDRTLPDAQNHKTLDLLPNTYGNITINSQCSLTLHTGTYFFNNWTVQSDTTIFTVSGSGLIVVHVRDGFTFRGKIVETQGNARPKLFVGVYGSGSIPLGGPFTGTLMALNSSVTLQTLPTQPPPNPPIFHSGAFYAKNIQVDPDNTIKHFPFLGPPTPTAS